VGLPIYGKWTEMQPYAKLNKGFRYILVVIDCYSKFVWVEPLKDKTGPTVARAMERILTRATYIPKNLQSDQGTEFYNNIFKKLMTKYNINHYSTFSTMKAAIAERVIRTLKNMIYKHFSLEGKHVWFKHIHSLVGQYNNRTHRTIGMAPSEVTPETILNAYDMPKIAARKLKYKLGDTVRISTHKGVFCKGYKMNWSTELFKIVKVNKSHPQTYILEDAEGSPIKGIFMNKSYKKQAIQMYI
jgi:hypothetical protein